MYLIVRYDEPRYAYLSLTDDRRRFTGRKRNGFNIPSDARPTDIGVTDGLECAVAFDGVDFWGPFKNFDAANYWLRTTRGHGWEEPEPTVSAYFIGSQKPSQFGGRG